MQLLDLHQKGRAASSSGSRAIQAFVRRRFAFPVDSLSLYRFDSKVAKHWFCKHCGIHPFSNPRAAPKMYSINVRCLDDFDLEIADIEIREIADIEIRKFNGRNWEEAIKLLKLD